MSHEATKQKDVMKVTFLGVEFDVEHDGETLSRAGCTRFPVYDANGGLVGEVGYRLPLAFVGNTNVMQELRFHANGTPFDTFDYRVAKLNRHARAEAKRG